MTDDELAGIYDRYGHLVLRRCLWILRDASSADDALQEVFLRLWRYGDAFRAAEAKVPWLHRVAERCCFDLLARRRSRLESPIEDLAGEAETEVVERSVEDRDLIHKLLGRVDDETKQMVVLYYLDELSYEEVGAVMGLTRQTVSTRLRVLRERALKFRARTGSQEDLR